MAEPLSRVWPERRAQELTARLHGFAAQAQIRVGVWLHPMFCDMGYFPADVRRTIAERLAPPFVWVDIEAPGAAPDLVLFLSHSFADEVQTIWALRETFGDDLLIAVWLWDNHVLHLKNVQVALAADLLFFSHANQSDYLYTPAAVVCGHAPACSAQWSRVEALAGCAAGRAAKRAPSLLMNYVTYGFAEARNAVIAAVRAAIPEANVLLMPEHDRGRYFSMAPQARFAEWAQHQATLILPINNDLSTRFFDALLTGLVPIVPECIADLDLLVPPQLQGELGIVRIGSYDIEEIARATDQALANFATLGAAGIAARQRFVLENHLLEHRFGMMLDVIRQFVAGRLTVAFGEGDYGPALYPTAAE